MTPADFASSIKNAEDPGCVGEVSAVLNDEQRPSHLAQELT